MNQTRGFLYIILAVLSFLLFQAYNSDMAPKPAIDNTNTSIASQDSASSANLVAIQNDVLKLTVNSQTGDLIAGDLLTYPRNLDTTDPLPLISDRPEGYLRIINGLYGAQGTDSDKTRADYTVVDQQASSITLEYTKNDVVYHKTISLEPGSFLVKVKYEIVNNTNANISLAPYSSFKTTRDTSASLFSQSNEYGTNSSYAGLIISSDRDNYEKLDYSDIRDGDYKRFETSKGWVAVSQHFFVTAYVPTADINFSLEANSAGDFYFVNSRTNLTTVAPGQTQVFNEQYWVGPKLQDQLEAVAPDLQLVVDYGWAWFLSQPLHALLTWLHTFIPNWGLTIIALTIVVRIVIMPLSRIQFRNQALMRVIQPEIALATERAGEDRMRRMTETQKVFQKYGASQFAGCLPALIQLPIFLALFYLMNEAVELRHQPFFGWIRDLSQADPYFILPVVNGLTMIYLFSLTPMPENMDPMQKKIMKIMPYTFMILLMFLPSGLIAYYIVSNLVTIALVTYYSKKMTKAYAEGTLKTYKAKGPSKFQQRMEQLNAQNEQLRKQRTGKK